MVGFLVLIGLNAWMQGMLEPSSGFRTKADFRETLRRGVSRELIDEMRNVIRGGEDRFLTRDEVKAFLGLDNDLYDLRVSTTAGNTLSTLARDGYLTSRVRSFVERLRTDLVGVLTSESVLRVPDRVILGPDDPNLAFYRFQDRDLEIGFT